MELYTVNVGTIPSLEEWETDLRAVKLPFRYDKNKKKGLLRLGVAKVQIYKLMFPEDQLDEVMAMIGVGFDENYILKRFPVLKVISKMLRKLLGLKTPPKPTKIYEHMQPNQTTKAVAVVPIGTRKDMVNKEGMELV